jgi:hypothetical protein
VGFEVSQPLTAPPGDYSIAPEYKSNGEVFSAGRKLVVAISDSSEGRKLSVK